MTGDDQQSRHAIVCAISADYGFALAALIIGVRRHNTDFAGDFVVFHDGIPAEERALLAQLWPRILFRDFNAGILAARFARVDLAGVLAAHSPMIFAKFEMLDLLAEYEQCLWLDVDMLVQGDLAQVWGFEGLAWRPLPEGAFARRAAVMAAFPEVRRDGYPLLNGGVVGMGQALRGRVGVADLYAMAAEVLARSAATSVDELALYFTAAARGLPLHLLDLRYNHPVVASGGRSAVIVHAIGPDKFWNSAPLRLAYPEWAQNAADWRGAGYDGPQRLDDVQAATPDGALKAARNRSFWLGIYDRLRPEFPRLSVDLRSDGPSLRLFIAGQPDSTHLRLTRHVNPRRIGVEICFAAGQMPAQLDGVKTAKGKQLELTTTKQGWVYGTVVPLADCSGTIALIMAALDGV